MQKIRYLLTMRIDCTFKFTYIEKRIWSSYEEYRIAMMRMFFDGYITVIFYHFPLNPIYILSYILLKIISIS